MAWSFAYPAAGQAQGVNGFQWWGTWRTLKGPVQMRLTDVTSGDYRWSTCTMRVTLRNSAGQQLGTGVLSKTWGVTPGFTQLAHFTTAQTVQLGTWFEFANLSPYSGADWTSTLRWDPALA
ncbi:MULTISPECIES: hypothetical protein [Microbacterium]|uniref:Uncharacterized protein n=1 Tax=Microbacterium wangchenii TaxID=2541726 RepID=A0ABX5SV61_9MICO|nr:MULTISPECIES: hypothetical protein [Microbacterium]MCK6068512.1 hypothetical protein [Microbacterium sp. EYE_512]QBR89140.1 hypothetical protein E4K62_10855 [Microbacterium wangchenii]TXK09228.1 hypothetical protein FVP99_18340 [Microbacterium wangchenii]